jgi:protocatechuate 3,4-dioxygenase beta subunit
MIIRGGIKVKKINSHKILIFGIILMLIFSFGPMLTSGNSNINNSKQKEKISNINEKKLFDVFEEPQNHYKDLFENRIKTDYNAPETAFVCGYVTDFDTGLPIEDVNVFLWGHDNEGNYWNNETYTNSSGYYGMHTAEGYLDLSFYKYDYFYEYLPDIAINPYETLWINVSLIPEPPETVSVCGYIKNKVTEEPISSAYVDLDWRDDYGHSYHNDTYSNGSGFYKMGSPAGELRIEVYADGYFDGRSDWFIVQENVTFWINISLEPLPPQTAVVYGYITDKMTGMPIEDANVNLNWRDEEGNYWHNDTHSDEYGFYKMYTPPGRIRIYAYHWDYDSEHSEYFWIEDNQTIWINLSLLFEPEETLTACGYVVDTVTLAPVKYAYVRYDWKDEEGHMYSKFTSCDRAGYYTISVPPGSAQFLITSFGYNEFTTSWLDFNESKNITWINVSILPEITINIEKPLPGLYINDVSKTPFISKILKLLLPNIKPIIIGPITIEVNITKNTSGVNRVEFYIDDVFMKSDNNEPYNFTWNKTAFFTHTIKVVAYDNAGTINIKTQRIRKFS